ncbi:MAG: hypothetical protein ACBZ72_00420 [Candidatus Bathyarchaeia archaeon]|jgi:hypothetical protein
MKTTYSPFIKPFPSNAHTKGRCNTEMKKPSFELAKDHEQFLIFLCFTASGLAGYILTHLVYL